MVISKTPFRMSFFGGGTDYPEFYREHGGSVLSTTFDKYCYVTARHLPPFFEYENMLSYSSVEKVNATEEIMHPSIRETMKYMDMRQMHVGYDGDLPARAGLGSSSSFVVGMMNSFYAMKGKYAGKKRLADEAIYIERVLCKESGGVQDQIAVAFGGLNRIDFNVDGYSVNPIIISPGRKEQLNKNLMLFFTGFSRISAEIAESQKKVTSSGAKTRELCHMVELVQEACALLGNNKSDLDGFGKLLDETWKIKRGITNKVSTSSIDRIYDKAMKAGAVGGKLLGAGGGGFILFYVNEEKQDDVRKELDSLVYVPFEFEDEGSRIMYYAGEEFEE